MTEVFRRRDIICGTLADLVLGSKAFDIASFYTHWPIGEMLKQALNSLQWVVAFPRGPEISFR
jgi:hypothetical protein